MNSKDSFFESEQKTIEKSKRPGFHLGPILRQFLPQIALALVTSSVLGFVFNTIVLGNSLEGYLYSIESLLAVELLLIGFLVFVFVGIWTGWTASRRLERGLIQSGLYTGTLFVFSYIFFGLFSLITSGSFMGAFHILVVFFFSGFILLPLEFLIGFVLGLLGALFAETFSKLFSRGVNKQEFLSVKDKSANEGMAASKELDKMFRLHPFRRQIILSFILPVLFFIFYIISSQIRGVFYFGHPDHPVVIIFAVLLGIILLANFVFFIASGIRAGWIANRKLGKSFFMSGVSSAGLSLLMALFFGGGVVLIGFGVPGAYLLFIGIIPASVIIGFFLGVIGCLISKKA